MKPRGIWFESGSSGVQTGVDLHPRFIPAAAHFYSLVNTHDMGVVIAGFSKCVLSKSDFPCRLGGLLLVALYRILFANVSLNC
jgi:hypothetical protein